MKQSYHIIFLLIFSLLLLNSQVYATSGQTSIPAHNGHETNVQESQLVITKTRSGKQAIIKKGQEIRIWLEDGAQVVGTFEGYKDGKVTMASSGTTAEIRLNTITQLKTFGSKSKKVIGSLLILLGIGGFFLGGTSLVVGLSAVLSGEELAALILLPLAVILGILGTASLKGGQRLRGKKYKFDGRWTIAGK